MPRNISAVACSFFFRHISLRHLLSVHTERTNWMGNAVVTYVLNANVVVVSTISAEGFHHTKHMKNQDVFLASVEQLFRIQRVQLFVHLVLPNVQRRKIQLKSKSVPGERRFPDIVFAWAFEGKLISKHILFNLPVLKLWCVNSLYRT